MATRLPIVRGRPTLITLPLKSVVTSAYSASEVRFFRILIKIIHLEANIEGSYTYIMNN